MDAFFVEISTQMAEVNANYKLDDQFKLTWEWVFGDPANNQADTLLGNLAEDKVSGTDGCTGSLTEGIDYNLELAYDFSIKIEQID